MKKVSVVKSKKNHHIQNVVLMLITLLGGLLLSKGGLAAEVISATNAIQSGATALNKAADAPPVFARVGEVVITQEDYDAEMASAARSKFYHGKPPAAELAALQREVGEKLVTNVLLVKEARRRGLKPDDAVVAQRLEQIDKRNGANEQWQKMREQWMPIITGRLQEESLLSQLEDTVRNVPPPSVEQIREYYTAYPEKFTEPEQLRVSLILLAIDPSSPGTEWVKAYELGKDIVKQLRDGADFAVLAREHPGDVDSAEQGGDMGYLHGGMLPTPAQEALDKLEVGEISDPVRLLEGVAIFRLTDRSLSKLNDFESIKVRAGELWLKEESERVWKSLIAQLKKDAVIYVDESRYSPFPPAAEESAEQEIQQKEEAGNKP